MIHDMYLYEVKAAKDSGTPWDYYKTIAKVPGDTGLHHGGRIQVRRRSRSNATRLKRASLELTAKKRGRTRVRDPAGRPQEWPAASLKGPPLSPQITVSVS
jgi:hypothetical protein